MKSFLWMPLLMAPKFAFAHCPLCTVGAGALAVLAASLGISSVVIGIMIGAFAFALGTWLGRLPKKHYIIGQYYILSAGIFFGTIIPIMPLIRDYDPLYVRWWGSYGTLFHNTYTVDLYLAGVFIGAMLVFAAPYVSRLATKIRKGKQVPYQGVGLTLFLLIIASALVEIML